MNSQYRFTLQPYRGPATRYRCPACGGRREFTRYVDTETGELLPEQVGRCNRADKCGYHYTPRQYFADTGTRPADDRARATPPPPPRPLYVHDRAEVVRSRSNPEMNTLSAYWRERVGAARWDEVAHSYALGTWTEGRMSGAAVYWQVDTHGKVRAGKIMLYDPDTGHRTKASGTSWVHYEVGRKGASELNVVQCLFGEHLLKDWPMDQPVAVVESEKTALIAAALVPSMCWVATGSKDEFKLSKLQALRDRKVLAFPDLAPECAAYLQWKQRAIELEHLFRSIHVSDILEAGATMESTLAGMDIADLLLTEHQEASEGPVMGSGLQVPPPLSRTAAEVAIDRMASKNPGINRLVNLLELDLAGATVRELTTT